MRKIKGIILISAFAVSLQSACAQDVPTAERGTPVRVLAESQVRTSGIEEKGVWRFTGEREWGDFIAGHPFLLKDESVVPVTMQEDVAARMEEVRRANLEESAALFAKQYSCSLEEAKSALLARWQKDEACRRGDCRVDFGGEMVVVVALGHTQTQRYVSRVIEDEASLKILVDYITMQSVSKGDPKGFGAVQEEQLPPVDPSTPAVLLVLPRSSKRIEGYENVQNGLGLPPVWKKYFELTGV
jgi:hypothetical protein